MSRSGLDSWDNVELGEIATLHRGYDLPSTRRCAGTVPVVSSSGVTGSHNEPKVEPPGVVTGRYGTLGEVFFIEEPFWPLNTTLFVSDFHGNDERFVSYLLRAAGLGAHDSAAAVPGVNRNVLHRLPVKRPPLEVQHKIAAILSAYDDLIENNNRRIKILEEMAKRIYCEWFLDFRYPGHEGVPLVDSELGEIPESWPVIPLSDVTTTQYGYTESATDELVGPRFLRGKDINKNSFVDWATVPYCPVEVEDHAKYRLARGDVVIIRMADPGKVGIVETDVDAVFASYLIRIQPLADTIAPYFLFYFLSSDRYQAFVKGASTGTTRKSLAAPVITSARLALPPVPVQEAFVSLVLPLRAYLNALVSANSTLRMMRDLLLPRLISGEIGIGGLDVTTLHLAA